MYQCYFCILLIILIFDLGFNCLVPQTDGLWVDSIGPCCVDMDLLKFQRLEYRKIDLWKGVFGHKEEYMVQGQLLNVIKWEILMCLGGNHTFQGRNHHDR